MHVEESAEMPGSSELSVESELSDSDGLSAWNLSFAPELAPTLGFFHSDKVRALSYAQHTRQLISCGGDGGIVVWNMDVERQEVSEWHHTRGRPAAVSAALLLASVVIKAE